MEDRDTDRILNTLVTVKTTRREFLKTAGMLGIGCLAAPLLSCGSNSDGRYDTLIRNGTVYDGTPASPGMADVDFQILRSSVV
jgi:uncharacterized protein (DUF1501 family)